MKRVMVLFISVILFFPLIVRADNVSLKCPSEILPNAEFSCDIYGYSAKGIYNTEISLKLVNLTFKNDSFKVSDTINNSFFTNDGKIYTYGTVSGNALVNDFKIGTVNLFASNTGSSGKVVLLNPVFSTNGTERIYLSNVEETVTIKNANSKTGNDDISNEEAEDLYNIDFSKGAYLSDLKIKGHSIDFKSDVFQYDVKIGFERKLRIIPVVSNKDTTYTIIGNKKLKDGSVISVEVIYKNQEMQNYYINVVKDTKKVIVAFILIGIIVLLILINVGRLFINKRNIKALKSPLKQQK